MRCGKVSLKTCLESWLILGVVKWNSELSRDVFILQRGVLRTGAVLEEVKEGVVTVA